MENINKQETQAEEPTMEGFLESFGIDSEGGTTDSEQTEQPTSTGSEEKSEADAESSADTESESNESESETKSEPDNKAAQAFAQMRIENRKLEKMIKGVAEVLGIEDTSDPEKVNQALQEKIIEAQAKKQNIPPEILSRLQQLEEKDQLFTQEQVRQKAFLGFQKVRDTFNLSNKEIEDFATELQKNGLNPFETPVDIVKEYKVMNLERLIADAEARGAQKEMERSTKATQQGSTPSKKQGQGEIGTEKITTVSDLEKWMAAQSK